MTFPLNTLGLSHQFIASHVREGAFCIDATCGRGRDTLFLATLCGKSGKVLAFDIQNEAVESTEKLLKENGVENVEVYLDSHANLDSYAEKESVDAIMFNFGWLPGGDHHVFSRPETSIEAIRKGLDLLKPGGVMSLCIYHGKETGTAEKDALLPFLETVDPQIFTVITAFFSNRKGDVPIPVFIIKDQEKRKPA